MKAEVPQASRVNEGDEKAPRKLPYVAPVLTKYGDIASLTRGAGNNTVDASTTSV